jgi:glyoxylase-like metal-dependent hydrolase (beta-lactamase superfamily II)
MRSTTITDNLTKVTKLRFVNAWLVREDDGFTLIDTTIAGGADALIAAAKAAGAPITRIALTHGHGDHVGSLDRLKQLLGADVQVLMPELDARIHAGESVVQGKPKGSWPRLATVPDVRLTAGDRIGSLEVVASPGHTPGHVSFLDRRDRTLIAGDSYTAIRGLAVPTHLNWRFPLASPATQDKAGALKSAQAEIKLKPGLLALGHGPAISDPVERMRVAVEVARRAQG